MGRRVARPPAGGQTRSRLPSKCPRATTPLIRRHRRHRRPTMRTSMPPACHPKARIHHQQASLSRHPYQCKCLPPPPAQSPPPRAHATQLLTQYCAPSAWLHCTRARTARMRSFGPSTSRLPRGRSLLKVPRVHDASAASSPSGATLPPAHAITTVWKATLTMVSRAPSPETVAHRAAAQTQHAPARKAAHARHYPNRSSP